MKALKKILHCRVFFLLIAIISLIYSFVFTSIYHHKSVYNGTEETFMCNVSKYKIDGDKLSLDLNCKEKLKGTYYIKSLKEKEYLENNLKFDLAVKLHGSLAVPNNNTVPNLFNYKTYLFHNNIFYLLDIDKIELGNGSSNVFYKLKNYAFDRARRINNEYINAFVLGDSSLIDEDAISSYRNNGISHLLALSGLHVGVFSFSLLWFFKKMKFKEKSSIICVFLILVMFSFITGFSPSIMRSVLFFLISSLSKAYNLKIRPINILYMVLSILLLINPNNLYNVGFILSFTTTFFLILSLNNVKRNYIVSLLLMSCYSFMASLGISIYFFGAVNFISPLLNLLFVPFVSFIIFPLSLITYIVPFLNPVLVIFVNAFEHMSLFFNNFNLIVYFPKINFIYVFVYYFFLLCFFKRKRVLYLICICFLLIVLKLKPFFDTNSYVYYLDVGQGDCSIVVMPRLRKVLMIDTGGKVSFNIEEWKQKKKT